MAEAVFWAGGWARATGSEAPWATPSEPASELAIGVIRWKEQCLEYSKVDQSCPGMPLMPNMRSSEALPPNQGVPN